VTAAVRAPLPHGRHDPAARRRAKRSGREKGCWTYISAEQLLAAGIDPDGPVPWFRVWAGSRGRYVIALYPTP
jgi:hypothetical protein